MQCREEAQASSFAETLLESNRQILDRHDEARLHRWIRNNRWSQSWQNRCQLERSPEQSNNLIVIIKGHLFYCSHTDIHVCMLLISMMSSLPFYGANCTESLNSSSNKIDCVLLIMDIIKKHIFSISAEKMCNFNYCQPHKNDRIIKKHIFYYLPPSHSINSAVWSVQDSMSPSTQLRHGPKTCCHRVNLGKQTRIACYFCLYT